MAEPTQPRRVAIFGGSFNPPHVAHVLASVWALSSAPVDAVLVVPVFRHPFAKELAPYEARLAMCDLAVGWIPGVDVSTIEQELGGESLTLHTLEALAERHTDWAMRLLIGADVVSDLPKWHRFDRIAEIAPPLVLGRAGFTPDEATLDVTAPMLPTVSSTEVRAAIRENRLDDVRDRMPRAVLAYAVENGLYDLRA